jgi:hypothetical protein
MNKKELFEVLEDVPDDFDFCLTKFIVFDEGIKREMMLKMLVGSIAVCWMFLWLGLWLGSLRLGLVVRVRLDFVFVVMLRMVRWLILLWVSCCGWGEYA